MNFIENFFAVDGVAPKAVYVVEYLAVIIIAGIAVSSCIVHLAHKFFHHRKQIIISNSKNEYKPLPEKLFEPEYGLLEPYERIMKLIYDSANPAELEEKVAVVTMNYQLKYGCIVRSMFKNVEALVEKIAMKPIKKIAMKMLVCVHAIVNNFLAIIKIVACNQYIVVFWAPLKISHLINAYVKGEMPPVRGSPATT